MSAFNTMLTQVRDRNWGGTSSSVACEPYISGYAYVRWFLPSTLSKYIDANRLYDPKNDQTHTESVNTPDGGAAGTLSAACTGVTPPGGTLNKAEFQGLGGVKWAVPTNIDYGNTITLKYIEFSGLPILRIHRAWVNMIRDNKSGLTALDLQSDQGAAGSGAYNKANYAANLLYWTTKPDGKTVEYYAAYSGVFPTKDPQDSFPGDITSIDKLEIDIDYNVDMIWHEDWVWKLCQQAATQTVYGTANATTWGTNKEQGGNTTNSELGFRVTTHMGGSDITDNQPASNG